MSQDTHRVEGFSRTAETVWTSAVSAEGARAWLPALDVDLDVRALYVDPNA